MYFESFVTEFAANYNLNINISLEYESYINFKEKIDMHKLEQ